MSIHRQVGGLEAGRCDITSVYFHRHGQYAFGLTFRGRFVPPAPHTSETIVPLEEPVLNGDSFAIAAIDEGSIGGEAGLLRAALSNGVRGAALEGIGQANGQNGDLEHIPDAPLHANLEFGIEFPSQVDKLSHHLAPPEQESHYRTTANGSFGPFLNEFDFPPQETTRPLQTTAEQQNGNYQIATDGPFLNDFNQESPVEQQSANYQAAVNGPFLSEYSNEVFSSSEPSQKMIHPEENFPTSSQETAFPFSDFDFLQGVEARPNPSSASSGTNFHPSNTTPAVSEETAFSFNDFNPSEGIETSPNMLSATQQPSFTFSDPIPFPSQESSSSNLTPAISPSTPATAPNSPNDSPDRHSCIHCSSTCKRAGDLKRHEKVHFQRERNFHCRQPGWSRKGGKGFYRKDKLKAHEKQVHKMHLSPELRLR
ncbi:hypothetical protein L207DRAFT_523422 [Hyaloscypha variabilis F]|uniref:C2H2-type domain-containing protein n=1 Tax=Hyaloscypha variabilis (strain UAMH 11265 / GT02V1 / F) TaxID=1149755 RepID=A0A2J6S5D4_HYAVF|nr:hypothetical protein L207DRAFT_523422 [Hyaloscypha variabilis F]